jgi:hypothetical protein
MEYILLVVIFLQFAYIVYSDIQNRTEREELILKIMSKDLNEYLGIDEEVEDSPKEESDPFISVEEAGVDRVVGAKDN